MPPRITSLLTLGGLLIVVAGFFPPTARIFESSMVTHMLLQMPLLALSGTAIKIKAEWFEQRAQRLDPHGAIALIIATGCLIFWMLPVNLDRAAIDPLFRLLKVISVPLGIGLCLRWVWIRSNGIVIIVVILEAWAMITRLGWLYLESPEQLCSSYLVGEQRTVGMVLLTLSAIIAVTSLLWGIFGVFGDSKERELTNP